MLKSGDLNKSVWQFHVSKNVFLRLLSSTGSLSLFFLRYVEKVDTSDLGKKYYCAIFQNVIHHNPLNELLKSCQIIL